MASTWNPSDKDASITLSNGNLTATGTTAAYRSARGTDAYSTGKYHVEFRMDNAANWGAASAGLAASTAPLNNYLGLAGGKSLGTYRATGPLAIIYFNEAHQYTFSTQSMANGSVVAFEIDFGGGLLWAALDADNWNNSGTANPATGTGGFDISAILAAGPMFPAMTSNANNDAVTLRTKAADFTRAVSSGFSAWEPAGLALPFRTPQQAYQHMMIR